MQRRRDFNGTGTRVGALLAAVPALALAGCGGGGGAASNSSPPAGSYDLQSAMAAYVKAASTVAVDLTASVVANGTSIPASGTGTYSAGAAVSGTFNGATALLQTVGISGTVTAAGQTAPYSVTMTDAYDASSGDILGQAQTSEYDTVSAPIVIPSVVSTTDVVLGSLNRYTDSTQSVALGTIQISVAVSKVPVDPGSPEVVQFTYKIFGMSQNLLETDTYSYSLTEAGVLSFNASTASSTSMSLVVTAM